MKSDTTLLVLIGAVLLIGIVWFGLAESQKGQVQGQASPSGSTFGDAKFAGAVANLATPGANGTTTSLLNTDGQDRYITSINAGCENIGTSKTAYTGTGLSSLTITIATSSTAAPASNGNTNTLPGITISTTSPQFEISSSTAATPGNNLMTNIWPAGTYLSFFTNATNTALCTLGAHYIPS